MLQKTTLSCKMDLDGPSSCKAAYKYNPEQLSSTFLNELSRFLPCENVCLSFGNCPPFRICQTEELREYVVSSLPWYSYSERELIFLWPHLLSDHCDEQNSWSWSCTFPSGIRATGTKKLSPGCVHACCFELILSLMLIRSVIIFPASLCPLMLSV